MAYAETYLGKDTPKLGFGMMRLPKLEDGSIDIEQVKEMVDIFMAAGLTYFDTAFVYDNGESEIATRKALVERYPRDSFTVTTKLNAWLGDPTEEEAKCQFEISRERL
ncbi:MAG: aldo/keto reductase, partial [Atopobiaceae bacterium]|nr:aldo/keto reductase [Atopobiaceae bacterium]